MFSLLQDRPLSLDRLYTPAYFRFVSIILVSSSLLNQLCTLDTRRWFNNAPRAKVDTKSLLSFDIFTTLWSERDRLIGIHRVKSSRIKDGGRVINGTLVKWFEASLCACCTTLRVTNSIHRFTSYFHAVLTYTEVLLTLVTFIFCLRFLWRFHFARCAKATWFSAQ